MHPQIYPSDTHGAPAASTVADRYPSLLILLDDFTHLAGLSDLYAETHPTVLEHLKRIKKEVTKYCPVGLTAEGRLHHPSLTARYHQGSPARQAEDCRRIERAISEALRASRPYSLPAPDKGLTERSIDGQRQHLIRHQASTDPDWLLCMLATADNSRLDRMELLNAMWADSKGHPPASLLALSSCAATLDALDNANTPPTPALTSALRDYAVMQDALLPGAQEARAPSHDAVDALGWRLLHCSAQQAAPGLAPATHHLATTLGGGVPDMARITPAPSPVSPAMDPNTIMPAS